MVRKENPFLMFGSYIGLVIGFIGAYFSFAIILYLAEIGKFHLIALLIPIIPIVLGFVIGWKVHSLIKRSLS